MLGKIKSKIPMISLWNPEKDEYIKIQRREYVRVESSLNVAVHSKNEEFLPFNTVMEDISAGGTAIFVPKKFSFLPTSIMTVWFSVPLKLGNIHYMNVDCQVIRLIEIEEGTKNLTSLKFFEMDNNDRQLLIRYCFEQQLEQRNKGVLSNV